MNFRAINQSARLDAAETEFAVAHSQPAAINVVVLYSEECVTAPVLETCQHIQRALPEAAELEIHLVQLDWLQNPTLLAEADRALAEANMIVVNANDRALASDEFQSWAESWPGATSASQRALVVFPPPEGETDFSKRNAAWMRELARRKGMDILAEERRGDSRGGKLRPEREEPRASAVAVRLQTLSRIESFPHFGINE